jgi:hypothetical protein
MTKEQILRLLPNSFYFHLSPYYLYGKQENMISSHLSVPHKRVKHSFQKSQTPSLGLSIVHKGEGRALVKMYNMEKRQMDVCGPPCQAPRESHAILRPRLGKPPPSTLCFQ